MRKFKDQAAWIILTCLGPALHAVAQEPVPAHPAAPAETRIEAPRDVRLIVRMQGPYDADVPLQVVCYFKWSRDAERRMSGAPVELDKRLGGLIDSLRSRGEFSGEALETLVVDVPEGTIKPKRLLLIGLGDESSLSLERMERVGRAALRQAASLGVPRVAFAPLLRDQGNDKLGAGEVETAVIRGMLTAYDLEKRLQAEGFAKPYALQEWIVEAGPKFYDETIKGVKTAAVHGSLIGIDRKYRPFSTLPPRSPSPKP